MPCLHPSFNFIPYTALRPVPAIVAGLVLIIASAPLYQRVLVSGYYSLGNSSAVKLL